MEKSNNEQHISPKELNAFMDSIGNNNTSNNTSNNQENIVDVMKDLEQKVNPKSVEEGINILNRAFVNNDPSIIIGSMKDGAKEFQERVGRPMTYSEMRSMWG